MYHRKKNTLPFCHRMVRAHLCLTLVWVIALVLTSSYVIDDENADFVTEVNDGMDAGDEIGDDDENSDREILESLLKLIDSKKLRAECTGEATKKTTHLLQERKEKDKNILRKNYQILQHGEQSIVGERDWLSAIKSGICSGCVVKKICDHPPKYLSK